MASVTRDEKLHGRPKIVSQLYGRKLAIIIAMRVKNDFQSVLRSLGSLIFINIISSHFIECESMLFVTNHIPYL